MSTPAEQVIAYGIVIALLVLLALVLAAAGVLWLERER